MMASVSRTPKQKAIVPPLTYLPFNVHWDIFRIQLFSKKKKNWFEKYALHEKYA